MSVSRSIRRDLKWGMVKGEQDRERLTMDPVQIFIDRSLHSAKCDAVLTTEKPASDRSCLSHDGRSGICCAVMGGNCQGSFHCVTDTL